MGVPLRMGRRAERQLDVMKQTQGGHTYGILFEMRRILGRRRVVSPERAVRLSLYLLRMPVELLPRLGRTTRTRADILRR